jgi:predicted dehydrogenase
MISTALIGYGYWGPNVARQLMANNRIKFAYICDKKKERLEIAKKVYLDRVSYESDYMKILKDDRIQAVCIAVETSVHYEMAKEALLAGKHVYVEKPFTSTVAEAEELKMLGVRQKKTIHVDHIMVYHPCIRKIKEIYAAGSLGDILYFDAQRMNLGQIKQDVNSMWDLAVHDLSIIEYITGGMEPFHISVVGEKFYSTTETLTFLTLRYAGFVAHIKSSWISPLKERRLIVAGTKKMIVFDDMKVSEKVMVYDKGVDIVADKAVEYMDYAVKMRTGDLWVPYIEERDALANSINHFIDCIESGNESQSGPDSAIRVIKILEAADKRMNV